MSVLLLTIFLSTLLGLIFAVSFLRERENGKASSPERDSLLPLRGEGRNVVSRHKK